MGTWLPRTRAGKTAPYAERIAYDEYLRYMSGVMGTSVELFRKQFGTQSGRSGSSSAADNAGVPAELWGQHGDWYSREAQKRCMKLDPVKLLSVSRVAMGLPMVPVVVYEDPRTPPADFELDVRIDYGSAGVPLLLADVDFTSDVVGVPEGAFEWS